MQTKRVPIEQFQMPYGKYKGQRLGDLYYSDKKYLLWVSDNFDVGNTIGDRVREFLGKMNNLEEDIGQGQLPFEDSRDIRDQDNFDDIPF